MTTKSSGIDQAETQDEVWFRFIDGHIVGEEPYLCEYRVVRRTPKGVWLDEYGNGRFVLNAARRRWAYPTQALALDSYIQRKRWQIKHATNSLNSATENLGTAERIQRGEAKPTPAMFSFSGSVI